MKIVICVLLGYLVGSLNPADLISKVKKKKLRDAESGGLGATNTALAFGNLLGAIVMLFDIAKAVLAVLFARWIAPEIGWLRMATGACAVLGHCFPFYLNFKGGKGLAAFGGVVLAYDPLFFAFVLITGVILIIIANRGTLITYYAALLFPVYVAITSASVPTTVICFGLSLFMMIFFIPNLKKAIKNEDFRSRDFIKNKFLKS